MKCPVLILLALLAPMAAAVAQMSHSGHGGGMPHAEFTPAALGTAADTARALDLVHQLREAIASYNDVEAAEAAGYRARPDQSMRPGKGLIHLGNPALRLSPDQDFDPTKPQALLYRKDRDGVMRLAGAMYTAPAGATLEQLDARVPLSVAHWHRHLNLCLPPRGSARTVEFRRAHTQEACDEAGGRFRAEGSRYMVHVMTDAGEEIAGIFPQGRAD